MVLNCLPGIDRHKLRDTLLRLGFDAANLASGHHSGEAYAWLLSYLEWTTDAVRALRGLVSSEDINRLVLTRRYELLLTGSFAGSDQRIAAFKEAQSAVEACIRKWGNGEEVFVVVDTNVYLHHRDPVEQLDFAALVARDGAPVHVLVPMMVVDELDNQKNRGKSDPQRRARDTLKTLERVCGNSTGPGPLQRQAPLMDDVGWLRGAVTIEIVPDPPAHHRLPIEDDEIVARTSALQPLAGRPITVINWDRGMTIRARNAGLSVVQIPDQLQQQPPSSGNRAARGV
ncbi:PIN domain-containing protein [Amycolatopsis sp. NPDC005232]|uniref:PIN domain-containing protein n=1 Tax=Amycolatopsis sp. NPDC005232 TaxID=3157027 RepID=UPI0033AFA288